MDREPCGGTLRYRLALHQGPGGVWVPILIAVREGTPTHCQATQ